MGYRMPDKESREHLLYGELKRILSILVARDVEKVILFGSLAAGDIGSESDIDLIVVERTEKRFLERLDEVYSEVQPRVATDILVYTPEEITALEQSSSFVRHAMREGRVLYEKKGWR